MYGSVQKAKEALSAMLKRLKRFEAKGWRIVEEQDGSHTVSDEDGRLIGTYYVEE